MIVRDEQTSEYGPTPTGIAQTIKVGEFGIDPTWVSGNITVDVFGDSTSSTFHARVLAGWRISGGALTVSGVTLALNVIPPSLTGLAVSIAPSATGTNIEARVTTLLGTPALTVGSRFNVVGRA